MHTLAVKLLRAPELEVGQALFEPLANMNILKLFLDQITRILNQIQSYLEVASINQLVENGHGLLEHVKLLNLLLGPGGYRFATLQSVDFKHCAHLLLLEIVDALLGHSCLLLDVGQVLLDLIEVVESDGELVEVLSQLLT